MIVCRVKDELRIQLRMKSLMVVIGTVAMTWGFGAGIGAVYALNRIGVRLAQVTELNRIAVARAQESALEAFRECRGL